ncbi:DNA polymerase delta catalytic subunit [Galdieria sulphuraria]|nr:DNA polymerase delta catalytic subunit [Galdieria sulphuraria]
METDIPGRIILDAYLKFRRELRASRCRLQDLSEQYLNSSKDDVTLEEIALAGEGKDVKITTKVGSYCVQDSVLVLHLIEKLQAIPSTFAMSKYTCTAPQTLYTRGVTHRIRNLSVCFGKNRFAFPVVDYDDFDDDDEKDNEENEEKEGDKKYEGAFVFAKPGVYSQVKAFDFNSLYPSIMIAMNICQSSFLEERLVSVESNIMESPIITEEKVEIQVGDKIYAFRRKPIGLFPFIAKFLIERRKELKAQGKKIDQNAVKIVTNSLYGALGAKGGFRPAAESVTAFGRYFIRLARNLAQEKDEISEQIGVPPLRLLLDKKMDKLLVLKKKKYAMLKEDGRIVCSGLLNNRDDSCGVFREVELSCVFARFEGDPLPELKLEELQNYDFEKFIFKARFKAEVSRNSKRRKFHFGTILPSGVVPKGELGLELLPFELSEDSGHFSLKTKMRTWAIVLWAVLAAVVVAFVFTKIKHIVLLLWDGLFHIEDEELVHFEFICPKGAFLTGISVFNDVTTSKVLGVGPFQCSNGSSYWTHVGRSQGRHHYSVDGFSCLSYSNDRIDFERPCNLYCPRKDQVIKGREWIDSDQIDAFFELCGVSFVSATLAQLPDEDLREHVDIPGNEFFIPLNVRDHWILVHVESVDMSLACIYDCASGSFEPSEVQRKVDAICKKNMEIREAACSQMRTAGDCEKQKVW